MKLVDISKRPLRNTLISNVIGQLGDESISSIRTYTARLFIRNELIQSQMFLQQTLIPNREFRAVEELRYMELKRLIRASCFNLTQGD